MPILQRAHRGRIPPENPSVGTLNKPVRCQRQREAIFDMVVGWFHKRLPGQSAIAPGRQGIASERPRGRNRCVPDGCWRAATVRQDHVQATLAHQLGGGVSARHL